MRRRAIEGCIRLAGGLALLWVLVVWPLRPAAAGDFTMKILVVNPSETEVKEFQIRSALPPEVKPDQVLDADGLKVEYDSQAGTYFLTGTLTLKPKESVTRRVVLEDVWVIPTERIQTLRHEVDEIMAKLRGTSYEEQGRVLASEIIQRLTTIESNQDQAFLSPQQHISLYHENVKALQLVESDLVSLRQLMVMVAIGTATKHLAIPLGGAVPPTGHEHTRGELSVGATWRLIFIILGLLGAVSLSFFFVWQRQLTLQLDKQATPDEPPSSREIVPLPNAPGGDNPLLRPTSPPSGPGGSNAPLS